jgi:hypothetical protein
MTNTLTGWKRDDATRETIKRLLQAQVGLMRRNVPRFRDALVGVGVAALLTGGTAFACAPNATAQIPIAKMGTTYVCVGNFNPQLIVPGRPTRPVRPTRRTGPFGCRAAPENSPRMAGGRSIL